MSAKEPWDPHEEHKKKNEGKDYFKASTSTGSLGSHTTVIENLHAGSSAVSVGGENAHIDID